MLQLYSTGVPLPFELEFAKFVKEPLRKEQILHKLLEKYEERINPKREFFRVDKSHVKLFFDLIDGEYLHKECKSPSVDLKNFFEEYRYVPASEKRIIVKVEDPK